MKKKLKIANLKAENAELKAKLADKDAVIDNLLDEQEKAEKEMLVMRGELHAYEVVHTGHH